MKDISKIRIKAEAAFTMVEVALSIAIVAFAMVAIIGVLPTGFQVQRDNREETIVNQDGTYLLEAIRGGVGLDELTNFVERITISNRTDVHIGRRVNSGDLTGREIPLMNGNVIIQMLSVPTFHGDQLQTIHATQTIQTNEVSALVRSISGSASQRFQANSFRENAFTYLVTSIITPYDPFPVFTNRNSISANRMELSRNVITSNLYDVRLHFRWPVTEISQKGGVAYKVGRREKVFRTLVSGRLMKIDALPNLPLFHFEPSHYSSQSSLQ